MSTATPQRPSAHHHFGVDEPTERRSPMTNRGAATRINGERGGHAETVDLDIGALIKAMEKCIAFYHQTKKVEFYAMVAEEYGALLPDREEVSVEMIEEAELKLHEIATEVTTATHDVDLPQDLEPHLAPLLAFYKTVGLFDASDSDRDDDTVEQTAAHETEESDETLQESVQSPAGQTDCSASNPTTPQERRAEESTAVVAVAMGRKPQPLEEPAPQTTELSTTLTAPAPTKSAAVPHSSQITYKYATTTLLDLTKAQAEFKERLRGQEELLRSEKLKTQQKKREYKALKAIVKQYRQREIERKRIQRLLGDNGEFRDSDDSDGERLTLRERHKLYHKETKRLRRLHETLSLKFQLLQSEDKRHRMKTEQQMAELRNEYTDAYVFGP